MRAAAFLCALAVAAAQTGDIVIERIGTGYHFLNAPAWSPDDVLLFVDAPIDRLVRFTPNKGFTEDGTRASGVAAITFDSKGAMYVAEPRARRVTRTDKKGKAEVLADRFEGKRLNAPNDLVVRRDGNLYFTDPAFGEQQDSRELDFYGVYRVSTRGEVTAVARWKTRPNGIALSEDGRMLYVANSDEQSVHAFDLDRGGAASNDRVVVSKIPGAPGGIRTDESGNIYVASRGGVLIYSAKGELTRTIGFDEPASNLTWGDPDLRTLYVTTRTSLFRARVGVKGTVPYLP
jgi:gluconolactonase